MQSLREDVEHHHGRGRLLDSIIAALRAAGKDPARLTPEDLAPVDEFHVRGREAAVELARRAELKPGSHVLDGRDLAGAAPRVAETSPGARELLVGFEMMVCS